jgi:hypothetical protein
MVVGSFANKGSHYWHYRLMPLCSAVIIQDARPQISNAPLTHISRRGQLA